MPKGAVTLMMKIEQKPGSGVEPRRERFLVGRKIRGARDADLHVHAELEFVEVHEAVDVMDIVVEKILSGAHCDDCF